ncbi:hypothetical protein FGO68_gene15260 [Halteria grandinella]|uniref:Uncharacterized protein n=1 Tax=Halteria grandinella TaxID=5974 RepID=A0A8J8NX86_HALGN|nr:hypothetical protein FGO68_gene15260 [Halteria grandinella]
MFFSITLEILEISSVYHTLQYSKRNKLFFSKQSIIELNIIQCTVVSLVARQEYRASSSLTSRRVIEYVSRFPNVPNWIHCS